MIKSAAVVVPALLAAIYASGAFDAWPRTVEGAPAAVMAELADLDIREQPGAPGSTAEASGGVQPEFRLVRGANRLDWVVTSGDLTAITLTATFTPSGDGGTVIDAWTTRGDAPDGVTSPAFRSEGLTLGLFRAALDTEIAEMSASGWGPECDAIELELLGNLAPEAAAMSETDSVPQRIAAVGKTAAGLARVRRQLVARGCNPDAVSAAAGPGGFVQVSDTMSGGGGGGSAPEPAPDDEDEAEYGAPMDGSE